MSEEYAPGEHRSVLVRMPNEVYTAAKQRAKVDGLSANQFYVNAICEALGWQKEPITKVIGWKWHHD